MGKDITINLFNNIAKLIESAKLKLSKEFNLTFSLLNWHIGVRINNEILKDKRAEYGKSVISKLSLKLQSKYGRGYDKTALTRMIKFAKYYPKAEIVATLPQQLSWSHFIELISIQEESKRDYYAKMCRIEKWNVRVLRRKISGMLYERAAIAKKPEKLISQEIKKLRQDNVLTPDFIFHDTFFLNFIGLEESYSETDLENAILNELA